MAVSNIVLRGGVGPTSTIPLFVTHGLFAGSAPASTSIQQKYVNGGHDNAQYSYLLIGNGAVLDWGFMPYGNAPTPPTPPATIIGGHYVKEYRKKLKATEDAILAERQEKLLKAKELRQQIEDVIRPKEPKKEAILLKLDAVEKITSTPPSNQLPQLKAQLYEIERSIFALNQQMEIARLEAKKAQDEEDIADILYILSNPFQNYTIN